MPESGDSFAHTFFFICEFGVLRGGYFLLLLAACVVEGAFLVFTWVVFWIYICNKTSSAEGWAESQRAREE